VKVVKSVLIDASTTYDEDYGTRVGLLYARQCVQTAPSYTASYSVIVMGDNTSIAKCMAYINLWRPLLS
jgi:hypothetical protein